MSTPACKACSAEDSLRLFQAKEMMFGLGHTFDYGECQTCGSLQILRVPNNLSQYYPSDYYSHQPPPSTNKTFRQWLAQQRQEYAAGGVNRLGWLLSVVCGPPSYVAVDWIRLAGITHEHRVLDVGCGSGAMLADMREKGFKDLTGVDPYMKTETLTAGFTLLRKELRELDGQFDAIMLHHSFEHMIDPLETLREIHRLLAPTGIAILRTPIAGTYAWRTYGTNWFQLDAPRHLFIPSERGFQAMARTSGLRIERTVYDSTYLQFVDSEQYARGIPLTTPDDRRPTKHELRALAAQARKLNEAMDGDQAGFLLRKATPA